MEGVFPPMDELCCRLMSWAPSHITERSLNTVIFQSVGFLQGSLTGRLCSWPRVAHGCRGVTIRNVIFHSMSPFWAVRHHPVSRRPQLPKIWSVSLRNVMKIKLHTHHFCLHCPAVTRACTSAGAKAWPGGVFKPGIPDQG